MLAQDLYAAARRHMVDSQLLPNQVEDERLLAAMADTPREAFVPKARRSLAYMDEDFPIAPGRWLLEPLVTARLLQAAEIAAGDLVLDIGAATGYVAALLSRLAGTVVALEEDDDLARQAQAILADVGAHNVAVETGALTAGWPQSGPYNVILVEGAVEVIPDALLAQLADGGRLATVVVRQGVGVATLVRRTGDLFPRVELFNANSRLLPGFAAPPKFEF